MQKIVSFGFETIEKEKLKTYGDIKLNKPEFGLFGSSYYKTNKPMSDWLEYVDRDFQEFYCIKFPDNKIPGVVYTLSKKARVFSIDNFKDYDRLLSLYPRIQKFFDDELNKEVETVGIDYNHFSEDYDALHITRKGYNSLSEISCSYVNDNKDHVEILSGPTAHIHNKDFYIESLLWYDCETWIIFNYDAINQGSIRNVSTYLDLEV